MEAFYRNQPAFMRSLSETKTASGLSMLSMNPKPVSISKSIWFFVVSSLLIYFGLYKGIPILQSKGVPFFAGYMIFFYSPFVLLFLTAIILYAVEGNKFNWPDFKERLRLNRISGVDWIWIVGLTAFGILTYLGLSPLSTLIARIPFFSPPDFFPAEINPNKVQVPGVMMDLKLSGLYWVPIVYFLGWILNIFGEELLWRGMILPRQIEKYQSKAWIYHGIIWTLWHFFWKWNLIIIFPFAMALSFVVYKRKNTWISIISHGFMNLIPLILIIIEVFR